MTIEEYFSFLDQYWSIFPAPQEPRKKINMTITLI